MDMTSEQVAYAATWTHTGEQVFMASAGQFLKIETSPGGVEILNYECPAGKAWTVHVTVSISETNA